MAPVCKFYLKGECRYGDHCKYDHPRDLPRNDNRFAVLQGNDNARNSYGRPMPSQTPAYSLNKDIIIADLSTERPQWILSAYGPGSKAPAQLFGGPVREQSFEEMRLHHYKGVASGNPGLAIQQANALVQKAETQMQNVLSDVDGAIDFIRKAEDEHPNRIDICQASTKVPGFTGTFSNTSFGSRAGESTKSALSFGQPSVLGAKQNPFGTPSQTFGQLSPSGSIGTFGQPSALGQKPNPFGVPTREPARNTAGPFSAFGATPNHFGISAQPAIANQFRQASQSTLTTPFGQGTAQKENPFAQSATQLNPFGQPANQPQSSPFTSTVTSAPFGTTSIGVQQNPFGNLSQPQPKTAAPLNPFAQSASTAPPNPFGHVPAPSGPRSNPLLQTSRPETNDIASKNPYAPNAQFHHPPLQSYTSRENDQRLKTFKGKPVVYKDNVAGFQTQDGSWEKIWFPDGPPEYDAETELGDDAYNGDAKQSYLYFRETGVFKEGFMPLLPPKREWCLWDF